MRAQLKRFAVAGAGLAVVAGAALAVAPAASATGTAVPSCVTATVHDSPSILQVTVFNGCATTQRVRVRFDTAVNTCRLMTPNSRYSVSVPKPARFLGLTDC